MALVGRSPIFLALLLLAIACVEGAATVVAAPVGQPAPLTAEVTIDRTHATVGEPVGLAIVLRYDTGTQASVDGLEDQFAPFEALWADPPVDQRRPNGSGELKLNFRIAVYRTGTIELPALTFPYTSGGQSGSVTTKPIPFMVESVIPPGDKASDIRPLKPQLDLPLPNTAVARRTIAAAVAALLVAVAAAAVWRVMRSSRPAVAPGEPQEPSFEAEAHAELDRISAEHYLAQGDYRTHYALIAECIRRYVSARYGFQASALTTTELSDRMVRSGVGRWRARLVAGLLIECDSVHYARYIPAPARAEADLQMAYEVVDLALSQETRPEDRLVEAGR